MADAVSALEARLRALRAGDTRPSVEDLAWLGVIPAAIATAASFEWLAPPLADLLFAPRSYGFFPEWLWIVRPEPLEQARFLIAIAIPLVLAGAVLVLGSGRPGRSRFDMTIVAVQVAGFGFVAWAATKQSTEYPGDPIPGYFDPVLVSVPNLIAGLAIGFAVTVLVLKAPHVPAWVQASAEKLRGRVAVPLALATVVTLLWMVPAIIPERAISTAGSIPASHIPENLQDYMAVVNGRTPFIDYVPRYAALLSLPLAPVFPQFDLSVTSFSITFYTLSVVGLMAIYAAFREVTGGHWTALGLYVPFIAISLFPWSDLGLARDFNGNYHALFPARYLLPFVVVWLCARHLRRGSPPLGFVFFAAGLAVLNNFEFGLACLIALTVAILLASERGTEARGRSIAVQGAHAAVGLAASLALVSAVILIRTGQLPDLSYLGYVSRIFGREGYALLPMPAWGLHWALYVTYVGALLLACVRYRRGALDSTATAMLAFVGVFGLFTGGYYAGRSDPFALLALFPIWGLALCLLAWTTASWLRQARLDPPRVRRGLVAAFAVMVGFGLAVSAVARVPPPWREVERLSQTGEATYELRAEQQFIEQRTSPGEPVLIVATKFDHRIAERANVENVMPVGGVDYLFSPREVRWALDRLEQEGGRKLFEHFRYLAFGEPLRSPVPILRQRGFRPVVRDPSTGLREWVLEPSGSASRERSSRARSATTRVSR